MKEEEGTIRVTETEDNPGETMRSAHIYSYTTSRILSQNLISDKY